MEGQGANPLFPFVIPVAPGGAKLDVEALWRQIESLCNPGAAPPIAMPSASPSPAARRVGQPIPLANPISWAVGLGVFIGGTFMLPALFWIFGIVGVVAYNFVLKHFSNGEHVERFRKVLSDAETNFNRADSDWQHRAGGGAFYDAKRKFDALRTELNGIPAKRIRALDQLKQDQRKLQLGRFLDRFELEDAKIEGIGPGRKRSLESYGIETAEDIVLHRLTAVPGHDDRAADEMAEVDRGQVRLRPDEGDRPTRHHKGRAGYLNSSHQDGGSSQGRLCRGDADPCTHPGSSPRDAAADGCSAGGGRSGPGRLRIREGLIARSAKG